MLIKKLKSYKYKSDFQPTLLSIIINPFYLVRQGLYKEILKCEEHMSGKILDVGCGSKPYMELFSKCSSYIGLEYESQILTKKKLEVDFTYDGKKFPFEDNSFDSLVSFQVLEHVFEPQDFISEMRRVLKPGGMLLITVPFFWDEHEQPFDYARYTSFGLKYLFEKNHFQVTYQEKTLTSFAAIVQLLILYFYKRVPKSKIKFYLICFFLFFPLNILGILFNFKKNNSDLYIDNIILLSNRKQS